MELLLLYTRLVDRMQFTAGAAFFLHYAPRAHFQSKARLQYLCRRANARPLSTGLKSNKIQTRRRFGGRQPLCGIGVTSRIARTSIPTVDKARTADSRP